MGHGNIKDKDLRGENISTVGVDIGDLVLQKGSKKLSSERGISEDR